MVSGGDAQEGNPKEGDHLAGSAVTPGVCVAAT